jgi:hypothetical protein
MYHYEMLGDERFQQFCQALIAISFPNMQCLPVGQPDGGRDAYAWRNLLREQQRVRQYGRELIVFQVKYVKNPDGSRSERDMIEEVVRKEKSKIDKLRARGPIKYYLITNVKGTAHLDSGSIDRVDAVLSEALGIEAYCWWRDDIDRRLDNAASIKWSYPEILKATDLLEKLVAGQLGDDEERRRSAIRAYMTAQYNDDQELKFKQTDLRSTMTELFFDLPMRPQYRLSDRAEGHVIGIRRVNRSERWYHRDVMFEAERGSLNAAQHFIHSPAFANYENVVLEGAPGQGKSTITQYLCQVLRMQLLGKNGDLQAVHESLRGSQLRIPFRVDLRDLAKWISGIDPFKSKLHPLDEQEPRSLEGFLAGQVRFVSGGHSFNVSDLTAVARASHMLLALDGFDEVAEINLRQQLVAEITKGTSRLISAGGFSVQTIVTSRPAAFAKSVRFPRDSWSYFELLPLEQPQIEEYTGRWTKAKGLKDSEAAALRKTLDVKLREPHTQYLAKNPMQLTILLSLINNRGASLPEKRTAMYDAYMDMFFSRESEKSEVVRDNRDLLIDIHRFLAWNLQTAAESGDNGSIEHGALRIMLFSYLDREGEDTSIVDILFNGIIERVGALVSRVQDTYEFEVQPLREYFAAKHLYETAPYPSDDNPLSGDKFDRFKALVVNPYWLNVARFYGGCFNKGEILTLVNELIEISRQDPYQLTSHARSVALMLLGDWVFTQYQPAVRQVVGFITDYPQLRQLLANAENGTSLWSGLPERSGRGEFVERLWDRLIATPLMDEKRALANAIQQNSPLSERISRWQAAERKMSKSDWSKIGTALRIYHAISINDICGNGPSITDEVIVQLIYHRRFDILSEENYFERAKNIILSKMTGIGYWSDYEDDNTLGWIDRITSTYQYSFVYSDPGDIPLRILLDRRMGRRTEIKIDEKFENATSMLKDSEAIAAKAYRSFLETQASLLATSLEPWRDLVFALRKAWGDCPAVDRIAFLGAGVRSKEAVGMDTSLENTPDLVAAARYIRLRSGAPRWWAGQLCGDRSQSERRRLLLLLLMWGTRATLFKILDIIDQALSALDGDEWRQLVNDFRSTQFGDPVAPMDFAKEDIAHLRSASSRLIMYIGLRLSPPQRFDLAKLLVDIQIDAKEPEGQFALQSLITQCREASRWKSVLSKVEFLYAEGAAAPARLDRDYSMPLKIALQVSSAPAKYPLSLVALADTQLTAGAGSSAMKLIEVAERDGWFVQQSP